MSIVNETPIPEVPEAPNLLQAKEMLQAGMKQCPDQAAQILASLGAVKNAKQDSYDAYIAMCTQLDVAPCDEQTWASHDKAVFKPLIAASLKKNMPFVKFSDEDFTALLDAMDSKSKQSVVQAAVKILMKALGAGDQTESGWAKLASAAASLV